MSTALLQKLRSLDPAMSYTGYSAVQRYGITPEEWEEAKKRGLVQRGEGGWEINLPAAQPAKSPAADLGEVKHAIEKAPGGSMVTLINGSTVQLPFLSFSGKVTPDGKFFYDEDNNQYPISAVVSIKNRDGQTIYSGGRNGNRKSRSEMRLSPYYTKVMC